MSLRQIFFALEIEAGAALIEARGCRLRPDLATGFVDRLVFRARDDVRAAFEKTHLIIP